MFFQKHHMVSKKWCF